MKPRRPILLRSTFAALLAAAWIAACVDLNNASADELDSALAREQHDELSSAALNRALSAAAAEFLTALPNGARNGAQREFSGPERRQWDFWPSRYPGARIDRLAPPQAALADKLLRLGLSAAGYEKIKLIQALEPYNPWSSPYYSVMVFGDPAADGPWGWRFQGHHLSLNFTVLGDEAVAATPLFLGTQPLSRSNIAAGKAPLAGEENLARKLYTSLTAAQRSRAGVSRPPQTYLPDRTPAANRYPASGVSGKDLSSEQRETLWALIRAYVDNVAPAVAAERRKQIEQTGVEEITFAWAGPGRAGRDHYYRVQGPEFLIEYDSRDGGSHIHSVWRSFNGDFGEDLLRRHLAKFHGYDAEGRPRP